MLLPPLHTPDCWRALLFTALVLLASTGVIAPPCTLSSLSHPGAEFTLLTWDQVYLGTYIQQSHKHLNSSSLLSEVLQHTQPSSLKQLKLGGERSWVPVSKALHFFSISKGLSSATATLPAFWQGCGTCCPIFLVTFFPSPTPQDNRPQSQHPRGSLFEFYLLLFSAI